MLQKKKKKKPAGAEAPQAPNFFFDFFFSKNNLAKILEILGILVCVFLLWLQLEKCILVQSAFSAALVG